MIEVKEILRLWLEGHSLRRVTTLVGVGRKTVRRYVEAAQAAGLSQDGGGGQLSEELLKTPPTRSCSAPPWSSTSRTPSIPSSVVADSASYSRKTRLGG